ncbi:phosphotransferase [Virgibacillus doumboii]|uniref:phosphotransferase n=1 Tax=Virgibacillus doumboii TaxID=2697503 RepID=UPI0013DF1986|nr:phosphotransferase [Virgibacillus doumboii]
MNFDRLSSFLYNTGMLEILRITSIKNNVFYLETKGEEKFILKKHRNQAKVEQQWIFFEKLNLPVVIGFERFPNHKRFIKDNGQYWTISKYIKGKRLNYADEEDRQETLQTLQTFHEHSSGLKIPEPLKKELFYKRWYKRLQTFRKTEYIFIEYQFNSLYKDIVQTTEHALEIISEYPWNRLEQQAVAYGTWIHGDVASHNFIRGRNQLYMIDFDLLLCAPQLYDCIQLGQRFLPYTDFDLYKLLSYRMVEEQFLKPWLYGISVPSDILREWINYLYRTPERSVHNYLQTMHSNWMKRQSFLKEVRSMLK